MASALTGLVEAVTRPLFRTVRVEEVDDLTPRVRLVTVSGLGAGRPGDKVQVRMGGLAARTYTPAGGSQIVGFVHGDGPGARWVRDLAAGDRAEVFGPRRSLDCSGLAGPVVVVGDETSVGLAAAVAGVAGTEVTALFEATDPEDVRAPAERLGLAVADVVPRAADGTHRAALAAAVAARLGPDVALVASGDAATVAAVRRHLKEAGVRPARTLAKAYWAEGRTGLD